MTSPESQNKEVKAPMNKGISFLSLLKEDIRHRRWMLVLSSIVQLLFGPIVILFLFTERKSSYMQLNSVTDNYAAYNFAKSMVESLTGEYMPIIQLIIAFVGAVIVGIGGFRHLFNRRMTDMVNSVPVKREKQFAVIFLNGFLIWLVPAAVSMIVSGLIITSQYGAFGFGGAIACGCFRTLLGAGFAFLLAYALVILAVSLSGTVFNAVLNIAFIGFDLIVGYWLVYIMCQDYFEHFMDFPMSEYSSLLLSSPMSAAIWGAEIASPQFHLAAQMESVGLYAFSLITTIVIGICNIILALVIYKNRKSEEAESGVLNRPYRFLSRTINSIFAGLICSIIIFDLVGIYDSATMVGWQFFFTILFSFLFYGLIEMIHARSFKGFFKHRIQMAVTVCASALILAVFVFDLTNFDNRIIPQSSIESAKVQLNVGVRGDDGCCYENVPDMEGFIRRIDENSYRRAQTSYWEITPEQAYRVITAPKVYYETDGTFVYDPVAKTKEGPIAPTAEARSGFRYVGLIADKKTGFDFKRNYTIDDPEFVDEILRSEGYMEYCFPLQCGKLGYPESITINGLRDYYDLQVPEELIHPIMDAYYSDFKRNYSEEYLRGTCTEDYRLMLSYNVIIPEDERMYYGGSGESGYYNTTMSIYLSDEDSEVYQILKAYYGIEPFEEDEDEIHPDIVYDSSYYDYSSY